jgi:hypothetical protein
MHLKKIQKNLIFPQQKKIFVFYSFNLYLLLKKIQKRIITTNSNFDASYNNQFDNYKTNIYYLLVCLKILNLNYTQII